MWTSRPRLIWRRRLRRRRTAEGASATRWFLPSISIANAVHGVSLALARPWRYPGDAPACVPPRGLFIVEADGQQDLYATMDSKQNAERRKQLVRTMNELGELIMQLDELAKNHIDNRDAVDSFREAAAAVKRTRDTLGKQYDSLLARGG